MSGENEKYTTGCGTTITDLPADATVTTGTSEVTSVPETTNKPEATSNPETTDAPEDNLTVEDSPEDDGGYGEFVVLTESFN